MTDVDADALKDLVRRANFLPYLSYGSPHDLSILEKISGYYLVGNVGVGRLPMPPDYMFPVGYSGRDPKYLALRERIRTDPFRVGGLDAAGYEAILEANRMIIGSPATVIRKLRTVLARVRLGILAVWTNDGSISHKDTMRCLELMGQEVLPALREIGAELELTDPFQKTP